jgi:hypothetical protein
LLHRFVAAKSEKCTYYIIEKSITWTVTVYMPQAKRVFDSIRLAIKKYCFSKKLSTQFYGEYALDNHGRGSLFPLLCGNPLFGEFPQLFFCAGTKCLPSSRFHFLCGNPMFGEFPFPFFVREISLVYRKITVIVYTRGMAKIFSDKSMVIVKKYGRLFLLNTTPFFNRNPSFSQETTLRRFIPCTLNTSSPNPNTFKIGLYKCTHKLIVYTRCMAKLFVKKKLGLVQED